MKDESIRKLTPKQTLFVAEYLIDLNASAAARRAGYSAKTAFRIGQENMQKLAIQESIQKALAKRATKIELTADKVLSDINAIKENVMQKNELGQMVNPQAALKACELEGKHLKMFTDNLNLAGVVFCKSLTSIAATAQCYRKKKSLWMDRYIDFELWLNRY